MNGALQRQHSAAGRGKGRGETAALLGALGISSAPRLPNRASQGRALDSIQTPAGKSRNSSKHGLLGEPEGQTSRELRPRRCSVSRQPQRRAEIKALGSDPCTRTGCGAAPLYQQPAITNQARADFDPRLNCSRHQPRSSDGNWTTFNGRAPSAAARPQQTPRTRSSRARGTGGQGHDGVSSPTRHRQPDRPGRTLPESQHLPRTALSLSLP